MTDIAPDATSPPDMASVTTSSADLLRHVLQGMSDKIAGRTSESLLPGDEFLPIAPAMPTASDVPDAPGTTDVPSTAPPPKSAAASKNSSGYAWGGYENGRIPAKALKAIGQGSHRLESTAADAWIAMRAAAAKDGVKLAVTDSYRSYDQQVAVRKNKGHLVATATPGSSVHGWGRAVDVNVKDPKALAWLNANGARFGWINPGWAQAGGKNHEPWHREFVGVS